MAHFAQDEGLCAILRDPNQDPFRRLAAQWLHAPEDQVGALLHGVLEGSNLGHSECTLLQEQIGGPSPRKSSSSFAVPSIKAVNELKCKVFLAALALDCS